MANEPKQSYAQNIFNRLKNRQYTVKEITAAGLTALVLGVVADRYIGQYIFPSGVTISEYGEVVAQNDKMGLDYRAAVAERNKLKEGVKGLDEQLAKQNKVVEDYREFLEHEFGKVPEEKAEETQQQPQ